VKKFLRVSKNTRLWLGGGQSARLVVAELLYSNVAQRGGIDFVSMRHPRKETPDERKAP
jgi:hypothetical protein